MHRTLCLALLLACNGSGDETEDTGDAVDTGSEDTGEPDAQTLTVRGNLVVPTGVVLPSDAVTIEVLWVDDSVEAGEVVGSHTLSGVSLDSAVPFAVDIPASPPENQRYRLGSYPNSERATYVLVARSGQTAIGASFPEQLVYLEGDIHADFTAAVEGWNVVDPTLEGGGDAYRPLDSIDLPAQLLLADRGPLSITLEPDLSASGTLVVAAQFSPFADQTLPSQPTVGGVQVTPSGANEVVSLTLPEPPTDHGNSDGHRTIQRYDIIAFDDTNGDGMRDETEGIHAIAAPVYVYYFRPLDWLASASTGGGIGPGWSQINLEGGAETWGAVTLRTPASR